MNDVSLWQNEIQFPVKNIWDSLQSMGFTFLLMMVL